MSKNKEDWKFAVITGIFVITISIFFLVHVYQTGKNIGINESINHGYIEEYFSNIQYHVDRNCSTLEGAALTDCITELVTASHEYQRAEADLVAQRNMDQWAFNSTIIALCSVIVTGIGIVFIALTLGEARRTTKAAIDAAIAADKTVQITREIGQAQIRAYVQLDGATARLVGSGDETTINIGVRLKNTGQSPTRSLVWRLGYFIGSHTENIVFWFGEDTFRGKSEIGGGQLSKDVGCSIKVGRQIDKIRRGELNVTVYGQISYCDVFFRGEIKDVHDTKFCFEITGKNKELEDDFEIEIMTATDKYNYSN